MKGLEDFLNEMVDLLFKDDICQVSFSCIAKQKHCSDGFGQGHSIM